MLDGLDGLPSEVQEEVASLKANKGLVASLVQVQDIFKTVCGDLKNKGAGPAQKQGILDRLAAIRVREPEGLEPKAATFMEGAKGYLERLDAKGKELGEDFLLCSSDIIESYFGKFKAKINPNGRTGESLSPAARHWAKANRQPPTQMGKALRNVSYYDNRQ